MDDEWTIEKWIDSIPFLHLVIMILLFVILLLRSPATPWGDVSQALIYHQVGPHPF